MCVYLYACYSYWYSFYVFIILHFLLLLLTYIQHNLPPLPHTQCNNNNNNNNPFHQHCRCRGDLFQVNSASAGKLQCVCSLQFNQFNLANFIELSRSTDRQLITWLLTCRKYVWTHDGGFVSSNVIFRNYRCSLQITVDRLTFPHFQLSHRIMLSGLH